MSQSPTPSSSAPPARPARSPVANPQDGSRPASSRSTNPASRNNSKSRSASPLSSLLHSLGLDWLAKSSGPGASRHFSGLSSQSGYSMANSTSADPTSASAAGSPLSSRPLPFLPLVSVAVVLLLLAFFLPGGSGPSLLNLLFLLAGSGLLWFVLAHRHRLLLARLAHLQTLAHQQAKGLAVINDHLGQIEDSHYQEYLPVTSGTQGEIFGKVNRLLNAYRQLSTAHAAQHLAFTAQVDTNNQALQRVLAKDQATIQSFTRVAAGFLDIEASLKHLDSSTNAFLAKHSAVFEEPPSPPPSASLPADSSSPAPVDFARLGQEMTDLQTAFQDFSLGLNSLGDLNQRYADFLTAFSQLVASSEVLAVQVDLHATPATSDQADQVSLLKLVSSEIHRLASQQDGLLAKGLAAKAEMHHLLANENRRLTAVVDDLERTLRWLNSFEDVWDGLRTFQADSVEFGSMVHQIQPVVSTKLAELGNSTKESLALLEDGSSRLATLTFSSVPGPASPFPAFPVAPPSSVDPTP